MQPEARVIVTGEQEPAEVAQAIRERAFGYFHKPLEEGFSLDLVQQALEAQPTWRDDLKVISAQPEWISLDVRCKMEAAERTTHFIRELLVKLPPKLREDVATALRELLMNGIEHGAKSDPGKRVRVSLLRASHAVIGHVADPGRGFSLCHLSHAAISNPAGSPIQHLEMRDEKGRRPGGFGILMARNLVDDLLYNERGNAAIFVKYV
jgi:two-component system, OmpR family, response regulator